MVICIIFLLHHYGSEDMGDMQSRDFFFQHNFTHFQGVLRGETAYL